MRHTIEELEELARKCRIEIVKMVYRAQAGHPGGSLSEIDLLAGLYGTTMRFALMILIGKIVTDLSYQKVTHPLECMHY